MKGVAAGGFHSLAVRADGGVVAWGKNDYGQLGDGTQTYRSEPVEAVGLTGIRSVSAGWWHSMALHEDGKVFCWGYGGDGHLGNGTNVAFSSVPVEVTGLTNAEAVAAGDDHCLAVLATGEVVAWGYNGNGQLGNGTTVSTNVPARVVGVTAVRAVAAGGQHSLALKSDGTLAAWGSNGYGQFGNGTTTGSLTPVGVGALTGIVDVAAGEYHSLAAASNGTVWAFGRNSTGALGDGTETDRHSPVRISMLGGASAVAAGRNHSFAVAAPDDDVDGVSPAVEDGAPNGGDGNLDGTADSQQPNVTSFPNPVDGRYITLVSPAGTGFGSVYASPDPWPPAPPEGVAFPFGFIEFTVHGLALHGATNVTVLLPQGETVDTYWTYGVTPSHQAPHWYEFLFDGATGAEIQGRSIALHFVDGLRGDDDLSFNGAVSDIGAPGITAVPGPPTLLLLFLGGLVALVRKGRPLADDKGLLPSHRR